MLSRARKAMITGLVAGLAGLVAGLPAPMLALEEFLGLRLLYRLRGPATPPDAVVVIGIDEMSANALGLDDDPVEWPRTVHAALLDTLTDAGVRFVGYDIWFGEPRDADHDAALAAAVERTYAIVLLDWMERRERVDDGAVRLIEDRRRRPAAEIAAAADATAPFHMSERPVLTNQYWTFAPSANGAPTLPMALFGLYAEEAHRALERGIEALGPRAAPERGDIESSIRRLRDLLRHEPALAETLRTSLTGLGDRARGQAQTLIDLYGGAESRYLNLYGPARSIRTIPIQDILRHGPDPGVGWADAAVFVGYSNAVPSGERDDFLSVYSEATGRDLSGVEIAATAFANMLDGTILEPLPIQWHGLLVLAFGLLLGAAALPRSTAAAALTLTLLTVLYLGIAESRFSQASQWWPVTVPLMLQAPLALFLGLFLSYRQERMGRSALSRGASLYLPSDLVERIAQSPAGAARASELTRGVCMATDLERFTEFSERSPPRELEARLNAYYDVLFKIVSGHGGLVTDIVGDSMVAVWQGTADSGAAAALAAAVEIGRRLGDAGQAFPRTRVGLHAGEFMLGTVGALQHLEYRALGDVVNSAARVQALNKHLGTTILATRAAVPPSAAGKQRYLGRFQLAGKSEALEIIELIVSERLTAEESAAWLGIFETGLSAFQRGNLDDAAAGFRAALARNPGDGASRYYLDSIAVIGGKSPQQPWDGVLRVGG